MSENPFAAYPIYLKATDIMDALQVSKTKPHDILLRCPHSIRLERTIRVHRDNFFKWILELEGKSFPA